MIPGSTAFSVVLDRTLPLEVVDPTDGQGYIMGDGNHRCTELEERWQARLARANEVGLSESELYPPNVAVRVIDGARDRADALNIAKEISVRRNLKPQTPVSDAERTKGLYILMDLHPDMPDTELANAVGVTKVTVGKRRKQRRVAAYLQQQGVSVPQNLSLLETLAELDQWSWPDLAKVINVERWSAPDLKKAIDRAKKISAMDWSGLDDGYGGKGWSGQDWDNTREALRVRLAYLANTKGWTDEQLVRCARYAKEQEALADKSNIDKGDGLHFLFAVSP
jgi:hypothetical protein